MKRALQLNTNRTRSIVLSTVVSVVLLLLSGCLGTIGKMMTGSFVPLDSQKAISIRPGVSTRNDVDGIMGKPSEMKDREYVYAFLELSASRDQIWMQEAHYFFNEAGVVVKSTFVAIVKGGAMIHPTLLLESMSPLVIGESMLDHVKTRVYPTALTDSYENGILQQKQLQYATSKPPYEALTKLPYIKTITHKDGTASYSLLFTPQGILKSNEAK